MIKAHCDKRLMILSGSENVILCWTHTHHHYHNSNPSPLNLQQFFSFPNATLPRIAKVQCSVYVFVFAWWINVQYLNYFSNRLNRNCKGRCKMWPNLGHFPPSPNPPTPKTKKEIHKNNSVFHVLKVWTHADTIPHLREIFFVWLS